MPNLTDILRTIDPPTLNRPTTPPTTDVEFTRELLKLLGLKHPKAADAALEAFSSTLVRFPKTLPDSYPYTSSDVAANGDLVRIPVRAERFRLIYLEGNCRDTDYLQGILNKAGIKSARLWDPSDDEGEDQSMVALLGNIAVYGIEFLKGDIGPYKEFFLLIKLSSMTTSSSLRDMFVWRLGVNSRKAQAWGAPWYYPKKYLADGINLGFDKDEIATHFEIEGTARNDDGSETHFPHIRFKRNEAKPMPNPTRWSHEALGGGFSFINPGNAPYPRGYIAPIENQGEAWIEAYDQSEERHKVQVEPMSSEFEVLNDVKWSMVFYGRNFQAVAKQGSPNI